MSLNQIVNVVVPPANGLGTAVNVATMTGGKSVEIGGNYNGRIVLLGSHNGVDYIPILIFDSGVAAQAYKQSVDVTAQFLRVNRQTVSGGALTMMVSSGTTTLNNFIALASLGPGASGPQASVDLWTLVPTTGLNANFSVFARGDLSGTVILEGSADNSSWNPIGAFTSTPGSSGVLEFSPVIIPNVIRYVRANVNGKISSSMILTIGGEQNIAGATGNGKIALKFSTEYADFFASPTCYMADSSVVALEFTQPQNYPMPACTVSQLLIKASFNNHLTAVTATVYKNGVATAVTVTIPALSTALFSDLVNSVAFAANDVLDIRLDTVVGAATTVQLAATLLVQLA